MEFGKSLQNKNKPQKNTAAANLVNIAYNNTCAHWLSRVGYLGGILRDFKIF